MYLFDQQFGSDSAQSGADKYDNISTSTYSSVISAARGEILDRFGNPLVTNTQGYSLSFNFSLWDTENQNDVILSLVKLMMKNGESFTDTLPISDPPFAFTITEGSELSARTDFDSWLKDNDLGTDAKASAVVKYMCKKYNIVSSYTDAEKRIIMGIRYEMDRGDFSYLVPYTFAQEIGIETITAVKENSAFYSGVEVVSGSIRQYGTDYAAHILGRVGKIYAEEYAALASEGYGMNAVVGKDGAEKAFESYLRGIDGSIKEKIDENGNVAEIISESEPQAGNNVILTIDLNIQKAAEDALANRIKEIKTLSAEDPETYPEDVGGGAAIMIKVDTGEILAMASYPTYNLTTFSEDYQTLLDDPLTPMVNRVIGGAYPPGSIFKMVVAVGALEERHITPKTEILDLGIYTKYKTFQPQCWIYRQHRITHGSLTVAMAIRDSCNYFFYTVSDKMGISSIDKWAALFGLGEKTGIELSGEVAGQRSNAEAKAKVENTEWGPGDTLQSGIGQAYTLFTPIQLCAYLSTVCNGGYYYQPHILKEVTTYDYSSVIVSTQPNLIRTVPMSDSTYSAVMEGMLDAAENGTAAKVFENYPIRVGGKTGSAQVSSGTSNGVFAAFAPYDDPEIAIVVIVEHGGSGSNIGIIAREMMDSYFSIDTSVEGSGAQNSIN